MPRYFFAQTTQTPNRGIPVRELHHIPQAKSLYRYHYNDAYVGQVNPESTVLTKSYEHIIEINDNLDPNDENNELPTVDHHFAFNVTPYLFLNNSCHLYNKNRPLKLSEAFNCNKHQMKLQNLIDFDTPQQQRLKRRLFYKRNSNNNSKNQNKIQIKYIRGRRCKYLQTIKPKNYNNVMKEKFRNFSRLSQIRQHSSNNTQLLTQNMNSDLFSLNNTYIDPLQKLTNTNSNNNNISTNSSNNSYQYDINSNTYDYYPNNSDTHYNNDDNNDSRALFKTIFNTDYDIMDPFGAINQPLDDNYDSDDDNLVYDSNNIDLNNNTYDDNDDNNDDDDENYKNNNLDNNNSKYHEKSNNNKAKQYTSTLIQQLRDAEKKTDTLQSDLVHFFKSRNIYEDYNHLPELAQASSNNGNKTKKPKKKTKKELKLEAEAQAAEEERIKNDVKKPKKVQTILELAMDEVNMNINDHIMNGTDDGSMKMLLKVKSTGYQATFNEILNKQNNNNNNNNGYNNEIGRAHV